MSITKNMKSVLLNTLTGIPYSAEGGSVYLALFNAVPGDVTGNPEPNDPAYRRQEFRVSLDQSPHGGSLAINPDAVEFPKATANWGNIAWYGIFSEASPSGSDMLMFYGNLSKNKSIGIGDRIIIKPGNIKIDIT